MKNRELNERELINVSGGTNLLDLINSPEAIKLNPRPSRTPCINPYFKPSVIRPFMTGFKPMDIPKDIQINLPSTKPRK